MLRKRTHRTGAEMHRGGPARRLLATLFAALLAAGCGKGGTDATPPPPPPPPPPPQGPALLLVSGTGASDTIEAVPAAPLVVEVRDGNGQLRAGIGVRFAPLPAPPPPGCGALCPAQPWVAPAAAFSLAPVTVATDALGRVEVPLRFGSAAGAAKLAVSVPELSLQDTARFTILPGAAARVAVVPHDTAVRVGGSFAPRGGVVDRRGNPRPDPVAYTAGSSAVSVSGSTISGVSPGRTFVLAQVGGEQDTAWVSVVPQGQIAVWRPRQVTGDTARLVVMHLDGTVVRALDLPFTGAPDPGWSPDGASLVAVEHGGAPAFRPHIAFFDLATGARRAVVDAAAGLLQETHPRYSADGAWIYFNGAPPTLGGSTNTDGHWEIWRVHPDGTGAARVGPPGTPYTDDVSPAPSPDGTKVAYKSSRGEPGVATLRILDLATGVETLPGGERIVTDWLAWSPADAKLVAFGAPDAVGNVRGMRIDAIRPDGTGRRTLSPAARLYGTFSWSPDGRWLVAKPVDAPGLELIEVATGRSIPLPFAGLDMPAWRP